VRVAAPVRKSPGARGTALGRQRLRLCDGLGSTSMKARGLKPQCWIRFGTTTAQRASAASAATARRAGARLGRLARHRSAIVEEDRAGILPDRATALTRSSGPGWRAGRSSGAREVLPAGRMPAGTGWRRGRARGVGVIARPSAMAAAGGGGRAARGRPAASAALQRPECSIVLLCPDKGRGR